MDAVSILSSPTPVTVSDEGEASSGEIKTEAKSIVGGEKTPPATETKPETPKEEYISPRFAMLAKEERRLQEERKRLSEQRKDPEFQEFLEFKKLRANAKQDPLAVMEKFGLSYDELTDYVISGKHTKDPSVRALEEKLEKMERDAKEREEKAHKDLQEAQLNQYQEQIKAKCLEKPDDFELVNIWGAHNLVYSVIQEHYNKTEEVLPIDEAAKKVEAYLEKESEKYQGSKKLRKLFGVPDLSQAKTKEADTTEADQDFSRPSYTSTTLSNNVSSGSTSTDESDDVSPQALLEKAKRLLQR